MDERHSGTIAIADRHPICRAGLRTLIGRAWEHLDFIEADTFERLLRLLGEHADVKLLLLDPSLDGLPTDGIARLQQAAPATRVVVIAETERRDMIQAAFASGAAGFIPRTVSPGVLIGALEVVLAGGIYVPESLAQLLGAGHPTRPVADSALAEMPAPADLVALTPRQREVLRLLVLGMRNKEIGRQLGLATGTVKVHVGSVLKTLSARNRTHAVAMARRLGLVENNARSELHAA